MVLYLNNYEYEISSDKCIKLFNDIAYHLVTCDEEGDIDYHRIELFKDVDNVSFSVECSCNHLFESFDKDAIIELDDDDKESILNFLEDINTPGFRADVYEKREIFQIKIGREDEKLEKTGSPTISSLEF